MRNRLALALLLAVCLLPESVFSDEVGPISDRFISLALQGDLVSASTLFERHIAEPGRMSDEALATQFQLRFIERDEDLSPNTGDEFADAVVRAYRQYWVRSLMQDLPGPEADAYLEVSLENALQVLGYESPHKPSESVFTAVGSALQSRGFYYLDTPAPPFRDLFLWRKQERNGYSVRLTDRTQKVNVVFISEIASLGWKHFATLGLVSTTGWVEDDTLYCVSWAYDRGSENFEISYLKHESRHLADFERFPGLESVELEYRAKLTELSFASISTRRLLDDFSKKSTLNPQSPHGMANYRVTRDMFLEMNGEQYPEQAVSGASPWQGARVRNVNLAARALLERNTQMLESRQ